MQRQHPVHPVPPGLAGCTRAARCGGVGTGCGTSAGTALVAGRHRQHLRRGRASLGLGRCRVLPGGLCGRLFLVRGGINPRRGRTASVRGRGLRSGRRGCRCRSHRRGRGRRSLLGRVGRRRTVRTGIGNTAPTATPGQDANTGQAGGCQPSDPRSHRALVLSDRPPDSRCPHDRPRLTTFPRSSSAHDLTFDYAPCPASVERGCSRFGAAPGLALFHKQPISSICRFEPHPAPLPAIAGRDMIR